MSDLFFYLQTNEKKGEKGEVKQYVVAENAILGDQAEYNMVLAWKVSAVWDLQQSSKNSVHVR